MKKITEFKRKIFSQHFWCEFLGNLILCLRSNKSFFLLLSTVDFILCENHFCCFWQYLIPLFVVTKIRFPVCISFFFYIFDQMLRFEYEWHTIYFYCLSACLERVPLDFRFVVMTKRVFFFVYSVDMLACYTYIFPSAFFSFSCFSSLNGKIHNVFFFIEYSQYSFHHFFFIVYVCFTQTLIVFLLLHKHFYLMAFMLFFRLFVLLLSDFDGPSN